MIITISGTPGSGKSTVAKAVAKALGFKHYSAGDFMREMAAERGITLAELQQQAEAEIETDREIDARTKKLAQAEDNFVIDSRLGFHFIPNAVKIFLKVDLKVAAERLFNDIKEGKRVSEKKYDSAEGVLEGIKRRMQSEIDRYQHYYGINHFDEKHYNFVLDTTHLKKEQVLEKVLVFIQRQK